MFFPQRIQWNSTQNMQKNTVIHSLNAFPLFSLIPSCGLNFTRILCYTKGHAEFDMSIVNKLSNLSNKNTHLTIYTIRKFAIQNI